MPVIVGKKLLNILMFQMYHDSRSIYREYIQNASDAIKDAVDMGILNNIRDGFISVSIDPFSKTITIEDNGTGISVNDAESRLLDIATSIRNGNTRAGQFGIGRLVGAGYCNTLSFRTSFFGESQGTEIVFDVAEARKIIADENDNSTVEDVVERITTTTRFPEDGSKHYFIVQMEEVNPDYEDLLNETSIKDYLTEIAPVDYGMPFKNQLLRKGLKEEYIEFYNALNSFHVSVNAYNDITKPYGLSIAGTNDRIEKLEFFKIENQRFDMPLAWGWYAVTDFSKAIPSTDNFRGIRLRRHNIQVGGREKLNEYFKETRGNTYFYGEIHITHKDLMLSASRDGLAGGHVASIFEKELTAFLTKLKALYTFASKVKNDTTVKGLDVIKSRIQIEGVKNATEIATQLRTIRDTINKLTPPNTECKDITDLYLEKVENICKEANIDITEEIPPTCSTSSTGNIATSNSPSDEVSSAGNNTPASNGISMTGTTSTEGIGENPIKGPNIQEENTLNDMFASISAFYTLETMNVLRKTFEIMDKYSKTSDKTMVANLKKKIIKALRK